MPSIQCDQCGQAVEVGAWPWCPHGVPSFNVQDDSIPGGRVIENLTPQPKRYYSKSEIKRQANALGVEQHVKHVPAHAGTDKSPHTQRWI